MKCTHCQSELPEAAVFCMFCGKDPCSAGQVSDPSPSVADSEAFSEPITPPACSDCAEAPAFAEFPTILEETDSAQATTSADPIPAATAPATPVPTAITYVPTAIPAPSVTPPIDNAKKPSKKGLKVTIGLLIGAFIISIVAIIAGVAIYLYVQGADGRTLEQAQVLADDEQYAEALELLDTIEDPSADIKKEIKALKEDIHTGILDKFAELLEKKSAKDAFAYLETYTSLSNYDELKDQISDCVEEHIYALMDEGEYIEAQDVLSTISFLPKYDLISRQLKYETFIIQCAFDLRPIMKNPSSLQINSVEFYDASEVYPFVIISESGQNGFGGYATGYVIFDDDDLTYMGSCSTLDLDDIDDDDYSDYLTAVLILGYRKSDLEITDAVFDLSRINAFIASGKMPNIDIKQYAKPSDGDV